MLGGDGGSGGGSDGGGDGGCGGSGVSSIGGNVRALRGQRMYRHNITYTCLMNRLRAVPMYLYHAY